jgi:hypothetical protein
VQVGARGLIFKKESDWESSRGEINSGNGSSFRGDGEALEESNHKNIGVENDGVQIHIQIISCINKLDKLTCIYPYRSVSSDN